VLATTREREPQDTPNTQIDTGAVRDHRLSKRITGCALTVLHALEPVSLKSLRKMLWRTGFGTPGLAVSQHHGMVVRYGKIVVGDPTVDLLVELNVANGHNRASPLRLAADPCNSSR